MAENSTSTTPWTIKDQIQQNISPEIVWTVSQIAGNASQAASIVWKQLNTISEAVGVQEIIAETTDRLNPMKDFVIHTLKVAFFIEHEQRISRGEYVIGSLSVMIIVWFLTWFIAIVLGQLGIWLWFALMTVPLCNLAIKRFHDLNKPGRWSLMLLIPLFGLIMPVLFKGVNENNTYGPDPIGHTPNDDKWYIITILSLFILSSIITSLLWFIGVATNKPKVDPNDPTMMGNNNVVWSQTNKIQQKTTHTAKKTIE